MYGKNKMSSMPSKKSGGAKKMVMAKAKSASKKGKMGKKSC
jgi:hypothetical protein